MDINDLLNQSVVDNSAPPPTLPAGGYIATVEKFEVGKSKKKGTPFVRIHFSSLVPTDTVDEEALAEYGDTSNTKTNVDFYYSEDHGHWFRLVDFVRNHLAQTDMPEDTQISTMLNDYIIGQSCLVEIEHQPSEDLTQVFARAGRTAPLPE